jgi:hypothetical protein
MDEVRKSVTLNLEVPNLKHLKDGEEGEGKKE